MKKLKEPFMHPWLPYNRFPSSPLIRLFCFHYSGGVASMYRKWQDFFPSSIEVCPVQLPGRENRFRESFITEMPFLIKELISSLHPFLNVPFALFGHSLGGLIAFELSRKLLEIGIKPSMLFISACSSPSLLNNRKKIHHLVNEEFLEEIKSYGAMSEQLIKSPEMLQILLPRIRSDFQLFENYCYQNQQALEHPIIAFGGNQDPLVSIENLSLWKTETQSMFHLDLFHGDHFYIHTAYSEMIHKIHFFLHDILDRNFNLH